MKTDKDIQPNNTDTGVPVTCNLPKANATCNLQLAAGDNKRILILDGATGTALQKFGLTEADFRGRIRGAPYPLERQQRRVEHHPSRRDSPSTSKLY